MPPPDPTSPHRPAGRWIVVASRFHEVVMDRLLAGALAGLDRNGIGADRREVVRVAGAFEVPQAAARLVEGRERPAGLVALAAVIRGETPHFDHVCAAATHGLMDVALRSGVPVGFGILTCDTLEQALARSGGERGDKGAEAAAAALDLASALGPAR